MKNVELSIRVELPDECASPHALCEVLHRVIADRSFREGTIDSGHRMTVTLPIPIGPSLEARDWILSTEGRLHMGRAEVTVRFGGDRSDDYAYADMTGSRTPARWSPPAQGEESMYYAFDTRTDPLIGADLIIHDDIERDAGDVAADL